jgi:omega-6 fatty acid desaturase (delta-12 desaturase)
MARDLTLYAIPLSGAVLLPNPIVRVLCGVVAGVGVATMFVWAHDAAHGALFAAGRRSDVLGVAMMLPSLQPYRLWQHGHNRVHHGFTSLMAIDWIWRPWTPTEYRSASPVAQAGYRFERSLIGCGWHYLRRVWWDGMIRYQPTTRAARREARASRALTGTAALLGSATAWWIGGPWSVVAAVVVPWLVFTWIIAAVTYLHHTHPTRRFYATRGDWDPVAGHVRGSTVVHVPRPLAWLLHDIFVHTPHHLDARIPYYRLRLAWGELRPLVAGLDVLEYRATVREVGAVFAACKLFEPATAAWSTFELDDSSLVRPDEEDRAGGVVDDPGSHAAECDATQP